MLYFLYGEDWRGARKKSVELLESLQNKKPDASLFKFDSESWNEPQFEEFLASQGLFEKKFIVFLDGVFQNKEAKEIIKESLERISQSDNLFLFLEGSIDKETERQVKKFSEKIQKFEEEKPKGFRKRDFDVFSLAEAIGRRDKKNLWVLYRKAIDIGITPEEINGILFWQIKSMIVASGATNATEAGLSPFVFGRAKTYSKNYSKEELQKLSGRLVTSYHEAHRGIYDFDIALERFVLEI